MRRTTSTARPPPLPGAVCRNSQYSVRFAKRALREIVAGLTVQEPDLLRDLRLGAYEAGDLREGIAAYLEKRKPAFEWNG